MLKLLATESVPEVEYATYMSEVYKISMVRMFPKPMETDKTRMYGSKQRISRNAYTT